MKAKICGITDLQDALFSIKAGAWALGFNFYKPSKRYIEKSVAKKIIAQLPSSILKVGIFITENNEEIASTMDEIGLDLAQVYKDANASLSMKKNMILSLCPRHQDDLPDNKILNQYGYLLIDAPSTFSDIYGGTGQTSQWDIAYTLARDHHLILAGGLDPLNVQDAIKNHSLIKQFLERGQYEN